MNKENDIKLSFVAPVYGVEKYIGECLDSLFNQDIPESEYEVVCVNDCTKDRSADIIREYQKKHPNLRLINHEVNKKDNASRNTGYRAAVGKYIWFIDPDDYIAPNCLGTILKVCEENQLDSYHWSIRNTQGKMMCTLHDSVVRTGPQTIYDEWNEANIDITFTWNRVYRRQVLVDAGISFREERGCDVLQTIQATNACKRVMDSKEVYYIYRQDNPTNYSHTGTLQAWRMMAYSFRLGKYVYELPNIEPMILPYVQYMGEWRINRVRKVMLRMPMNELRDVYRMLDGEPEVKNFALAHCNSQVRFMLEHPILTMMMNCVYRPLVAVRNGIVKK